MGPGPPRLLAGDPQPRRLFQGGARRSRTWRDRPLVAEATRLRDEAPDEPRRGWASMCLGWITDNLLADREAAPAHYELGLEAARASATPCCCSRRSATSATTPTTTATSPARASDGRSRPLPAPGRGTSAGRSRSSCCWPCCTATRVTRRAPGRSPARCCGGRAPSVRRRRAPGRGLPGRRRPDARPGRRAARSLIAGIRRRWFQYGHRGREGGPVQLRAEHLDHALGIGEREPRLSWRLPAGRSSARVAYEVELDDGTSVRVEGGRPRPGARAGQGAGVGRTPGGASPRRDRGPVPASGPSRLSVEAGLLDPEDWSASWTSTRVDKGAASRRLGNRAGRRRSSLTKPVVRGPPLRDRRTACTRRPSTASGSASDELAPGYTQYAPTRSRPMT